ncbi:MAG: hypothetical protein QM790_16115 [Nibricoccus sp.]
MSGYRGRKAVRLKHVHSDIYKWSKKPTRSRFELPALVESIDTTKNDVACPQMLGVILPDIVDYSYTRMRSYTSDRAACYLYFR